ncbi:hypothetical protein Hanom_Chr10g00955791 [Helianthus anomalus]
MNDDNGEPIKLNVDIDEGDASGDLPVPENGNTISNDINDMENNMATDDFAFNVNHSNFDSDSVTKVVESVEEFVPAVDFPFENYMEDNNASQIEASNVNKRKKIKKR